MVISSATGMLQKFYRAYSRYFADTGYAVLTFDYHGIGASGGQVRELRNNRFDLVHWGSNDQAGAVRYLKTRFPEVPLTLVTHSIGGQLCGFNPEFPNIDRIILVASQSGYWRLYSGWHKWKLWKFWHVLIPWLTPLFGYFPAKPLGLFENLPREMVWQWSRWGKHPDYMMSEAKEETHHFRKINTPLLSLSFPGDTLAPPAAVDWLTRQYAQARVTRVHYTREGKQPGHFGYFRPAFRETLWEATHQWITKNEWDA
jgi:predicted alpha/beta hydrolase